MNKETTKTYSQYTGNTGNTYHSHQLLNVFKSRSNRMSVIEAHWDNEIIENDYKYRSRNAFYASQSPKGAGYRAYYRKKRKQLNGEFNWWARLTN